MAEHTYDEIEVGQTTEFSVVLTESLVAQFSEVSGDTNPLHVDEEYAQTTDFGGRIVHGQLGASFFSRLVGMHLPGKYALYLGQDVVFRKPMRIGMEVVVRGEVVKKTDVARALSIKTEVLDSKTEQMLISGEALVKVLK